MENLFIYEKSRSVPPEAQKAFNNGSFSGTDINPMWRIKKLTELFGACGIGWYYDVLSERSEVHGDMTMAIVDLNLYIKVDGEWSKPIYGTGGNKLVSATKSGQVRTSDEGYKMALTDALSVACKALGIGADIYWSSDRTKYSAADIGGTKVEKGAVMTNPNKAVLEIIPVCESCSSPIMETKGKTKVWSPEETAEWTKKKCGKVLCFSCYNSTKEG